MSRIVGIDLGTTNSVVAVMEGGDAHVITLAEGTRLCPSVVGFARSGERLIGQLAKRQAITNPDRTFASIKRFMGTDHHVSVGETLYSAPEISAMILQKLKADAEAYLGEPVTKAVITVPAYFNDGQRQATKDAGQIAGLEVLRILNEPTAAALAFGMERDATQTIMVLDLGGGTFDVSILALDNGVYDVKATCGDTRLGGDDWDDAIISWAVTAFKENTGADLSGDSLALQRLKEAAEKAKIELSALLSSTINLPFLSQSADGPLHLDLSLTRAHFEALTASLRARMRDPIYQALMDAGMKTGDIHKVVLVGGSTRMPAVQEMVREMFRQEPFKGLNPDEVVAVGAAIQAGVLAGEVVDVVLHDVTPLSLGIETHGRVMTRLIDRNTTIPAYKTQIFTTSVDGQTTVDIHVLQGEREMAADNKSLGCFQLTGITPGPRGIPKIEVTFEIDGNGIVRVRALDKATGQEQKIVVTASSGLTREEVERLIAEAREHASHDRQRREDQETRNQADHVLYQAEKTLADAHQRLAGYLVDPAQQAATALRNALETSNASEIATAANALTEAMYSLARQLYDADESH